MEQGPHEADSETSPASEVTDRTRPDVSADGPPAPAETAQPETGPAQPEADTAQPEADTAQSQTDTAQPETDAPEPPADSAEPPEDAAPPQGSTEAGWWRRTPRYGKVLLSAGVVLLLLVACAAGVYWKLSSNISTQKMDIIGKRPAPAPTNAQGQRPMNILVLGSQTRDGQTGPNLGNSSKLGTNISDTAMLVHLTADRKHAIVVSIPRDLIVPRPACRSASDPNTVLPASDTGGDDDMFDAAMNLGGPSCAAATVEQMSGLRVDHFMMIKFNGFEKMVDAVGGVNVCVPQPGINDWRSGLVISAGQHVVKGYQALAFVRDRHGIGDGGDLGRIQMQQMFISSLIQKIESAHTLSNPATVWTLANTATSSLTTDPGLGSIPSLVGLASQLTHISSGNVTFITVPNTTDPQDTNRLIPDNPQYQEVWTLLRADQPWTGKLPNPPSSHGNGDSTATNGLSKVPGASSVHVRVVNGSGEQGKAGTVADRLRAMGFDVTGVDSTTVRTQTSISAGTGSGTLRGVVGGDPATGTSTGDGQVTLTIGTDFGGIHAPSPSASASPSPTPTPTYTASAAGIETRTGNQDICSGLPTPRSDAGRS